MENNVLKIENLKDGSLSIRLKPSEFTECDLYQSIVVILEWAESLYRMPPMIGASRAKKIDAEMILTALKSKERFREHVYNSFQGDFFEKLKAEEKHG